MRYRLPILIARLALALAWPLPCSGCSGSAGSRVPPPAAASASDALPMASVVTLAGDATDLRAAIRGRVAIVSFWATWCDACSDEMDALNRLHARTLARGDAVVVGVAVGEPRDAVAAFAKRRGLAYAQLVDEDFRLADALGQRRVPATIVVDRAGRVVFRGEALDASGLAAFKNALGAAN